MPLIINTINETVFKVRQKPVVDTLNTELTNLPKSRDWRIIIRFVSANTIKKINRQYLDKNFPTDVLSFPVLDFKRGVLSRLPPGPLLLGEVIINLEEVLYRIKEPGHSFIKEVQSLIAHGARHLIGFHH